jgi:hypothetical protein
MLESHLLQQVKPGVASMLPWRNTNRKSVSQGELAIGDFLDSFLYDTQINSRHGVLSRLQCSGLAVR